MDFSPGSRETNPPGGRDEASGRSGQSLLGIFSFILALLAGLGVLILVVISGVLEVRSPGSISGGTSGTAVAIGLLIILCALTDLAAAGLGIAGVIQRRRKRVFAVLGVVLSVLTLLGFLVLILVGFAVSA